MTDADSPGPRDFVDELRRWEVSGASWRARPGGDGRLVVELVTCTGDEVVERLETTDPAVVTFVAGRRSSEEPAPTP